MTQLIVNDHPQWNSTAQWQTAIEGTLAVGAVGVRVDAEWDSSDPWEVDANNDSAIKQYLTLAESLGCTIREVVLVDPSPSAANVSGYANAAATLATLGVTSIDIENEEDYNDDNAALYAQYVNAAVPAIHAANPDVTIGVGVISNINGDGSGWNFTFGSSGFLAQLNSTTMTILQQVGKFVCHEYDGWSGPVNNNEPAPPAKWWDGNGVLEETQAFVTELRTSPWGSLPYWIDETAAVQSSVVSAAEQGTWTTELFQAYASLTDAPEVIGYYQLSDQGNSPDIDWGLYTDEGVTIKPSGTATKAYWATTPVPPTPPVTTLPDLTIESLSISPAAPVVGDVVSFSAVVKNIGTGATPAGIVVGVAFDVDGTEVSWSDTDATALGVGDTVTLVSDASKPWTATEGSHTLLGNVNDIKRFVESSYTNNTLLMSFSVAAKPAETADEYAAAHGMVIVDKAEAREAHEDHINVYTWDLATTSMVGWTGWPELPTTTIYAFASALDEHGIHHAGA